MYFEYIAANLGFLALLVVYVTNTERGKITPIDAFMFFFAIQYGFHAIFPTSLRESEVLASATTLPRYLWGLSAAYYGLIAGVLSGNFWSRFLRLGQTRAPAAQAPLVSPGLAFLRRRSFLYLIVGYILLFMAVQGPTLPVLTEYVKYLLGASSYSYTDIRRVLFVDTPYMSLAAATRFTISAVLFSALVARVYLVPDYRIFFSGLLIVFYAICAAQLNKFPMVFYFLVTFLTISQLNWNVFREKTGARFYAISAILGVFVAVALYFLYKIQYAKELKTGLVTLDELREVLLYRVFFASNDGLRLWFDAFPAKVSYIGIANIPILAKFFGVTPFAPTETIPAFYTGDLLTTMQVGFMGSSYASFGYVGLAIVAFVVGVLVKMIDSVYRSFDDLVVKSIFGAVMCLDMFFLTTREFHTALVSGGVVLVPLVFYLARYFKVI